MKVQKPSANISISRYDYAVERLRALGPRLPSKDVFDIGPGDGRLRTIENDGFSWRGFDISAWRDVLKWDLTDPCPIPSRAGAVLLLEVIEHCVNPGLALINIGAAIEDGGYLILTTPNPAWSGCRVHMLFRGLIAGFTPEDLDENHHVLPIWPHVLERLLQYAGFAIEEFVTLDGKTTMFSQPGKMFRPARYLLNVVQMTIERCDTGACGMTYAVIARKCAPANGPASLYPRL
jgi:hypothetical protein